MFSALQRGCAQLEFTGRGVKTKWRVDYCGGEDRMELEGTFVKGEDGRAKMCGGSVNTGNIQIFGSYLISAIFGTDPTRLN